MVHDGVELLRQQPVDIRNAGVDRRFQVPGDRHRPMEYFVHQRRDLLAGLGPLFVVTTDTGLGDDLVEQADFLLMDFQDCLGLGVFVTHLPSPLRLSALSFHLL